MTLYLCIDGGGTKTIAAIALVPRQGSTAEVIHARGTAGPSNLTSGLDACISATVLAVRQTLFQLAELSSSDVGTRIPRPNAFRRVWAGYAGCGRQADHDALFPPLQKLFEGSDLRLTSDAELLAAGLQTSPCQAGITLICGTGCLAQLWRKNEDGVVSLARRSGGWGPLLGDEGSGWSMGRTGIKSVLTYAANGMELVPWQRAILTRYGVKDPDRLITAVSSLDASLPHATADSERKTRIASCARVVLEAAAEGEGEALRVVTAVAAEVVEVLRPLVVQHGAERLGDVLLIVAGGLGQVDIFWRRVSDLMSGEGWRWHSIAKVEDPAEEGLRAIMQHEST